MSNQYKQFDIRINIQNFFKSILTSSIEENKVLKGNSVCPITYQQIKDKYMNCYICNKNFDQIALKTWLSKKFTCPICRQLWTSPFVFVNCKIKNKVILKEDKYDSDEALKSISDSDDKKYDSDEELKSISDSDDDKYDSD